MTDIPILGQQPKPASDAPQLQINAKWLPQIQEVAVQFSFGPTAWVLRLPERAALQIGPMSDKLIRQAIAEGRGTGLMIAQAQIPPDVANPNGSKPSG